MAERVAELCIERWELAAIQPHPKNPRTVPPKGSKKWDILKRSLDFDYFDPLVVNRRNGQLVSGHQRHPTLIELGFTWADVSVVEYDEPIHLARMIAANKHIGEFEETMLAQLAGEIDDAGLDVALAGMDEKGFMALLEPPPVVDDSKAAAELVSGAELLQAKWQVKLGDLYQIGTHRLLCGDCALMDNWQLLLDGRQADMVWTDPPYNIDYADLQKHRNKALKRKARKEEPLQNDAVTDKRYLDLLRAWFGTALQVTKPGGAIYISHAESQSTPTRQAVAEVGWRIAQVLVWVKNSFNLGRQDYQWQHEPILYGWRPGAAHFWQGGYSQSTVIDDEETLKGKNKAELLAIINQLRNERETTIIREGRQTGDALHPTIKPVPLVARHVWNSCRRGETVAELFGGSGTTLAAAEQTGRQCVAAESDPKYCAVILERMSAYGLPIEKIRHG